MNGSAYLALAHHMASGSSEAEYRTSVSRGYYGAFHLACELVNRCGVRLPRTADAHNKLQWCLSQAGSPDLLLAASLLASLRSARHAADYDLGAAEFRKSAYVAQQA